LFQISIFMSVAENAYADTELSVLIYLIMFTEFISIDLPVWRT